MAARVKSIISGDTIVIAPAHLPPSEANEKQLSLAYVSAPRMAGNEPFAFESREYLRSLLIGKPVNFKVLYSINGRDYGDVSAPIFDSLIERTLAAGFVNLRDDSHGKTGYEQYEEKLEVAQKSAQSAQSGLWAPQHSTITEVPLPESLYGSGKELPAIVEKVISGDRIRLRAIINDSTHFVGLAVLAGVRTPRTAHNDVAAEPFGDQARAFVNNRLLQRSIKVQFPGSLPGATAPLPLVNIIYSAGDIVQLLVSNGLATVADQQSTIVGAPRMQVLRSAQRAAEEKHLNLWHNRTAKKLDAKNYDATVLRVVSSDTYVIVTGTDIEAGDEKTVQLSSLRAPRKTDATQAPYMAAAKEYARALVAGKTVKVHVDAIRPKSEQFDERELVSLIHDGTNIALRIVQAGYASVIKHRGDDTDKSSHIDELLAAELQATTNNKGMHGKKAPTASRVVDASESQVRAKGFLPSLQRRQKIPGVVDFVSPTSAGRMRVLLPSENCMITIVLAGIKVPRQGETGFDEAVKYITRHLTQRDVQVSVQNSDKTNAFISLVYVAGSARSLSSQLVALGLASVHQGAAIAAGIDNELEKLESQAISARKGIWANYEHEAEAVAAAPVESQIEKKSSVPLNTYLDAFIFASHHATALRYRLKPNQERFEQLTKDLDSFYSVLQNSEKFEERPPKGTLVAVKHHGSFARGKILRYDGNIADVELFDYSEETKFPYSSLKQLAPKFFLSVVPALSSVARLAYVCYPSKNYIDDLRNYLDSSVVGKYVVISFDTPETITLFTSDSKSADDSLNSRIITEGYSYLFELDQVSAAISRLSIDVTRLGGGNPEVVARLKIAQEQAKNNHIGMWEYGDPREFDDLLRTSTTEESLLDPLLGPSISTKY